MELRRRSAHGTASLVPWHPPAPLDAEQIILGELQHYLRVRTNPIHWSYILINAVAKRRYDLMDVVQANFKEELGGPQTHVDIMLQMLEEGGITREEADCTEPAPGTLAAIETINGCCQHRSALEGLAMLSLVEAQHAVVAAKVYGADWLQWFLGARRRDLSRAWRAGWSTGRARLPSSAPAPPTPTSRRKCAGR